MLVSDTASARRSASPAQTKPQPPKGPLTLVVSIRKQRVSVYGPDGKLAESPVSTGRSGYDTPTGVFTVLGKEVMHYSNLYGDAPMPFMNRITWSGVALHAGALPGYPASHGCIRLPYGFARTLYGMTKVGTRVIVASDDVQPQAIAHPALFTPLPSEVESGLAPTLAVSTAAKVSDMGGVVPALVGITPATAAEQPPSAEKPRRTRETVAAERAAETQRLVQHIAALEARRAELEPSARAAAEAATAATLATRDVRAEGDRLARNVQRLVKDLEATSGELVRLGKRSFRRMDPGALDRAAAEEDALEEKILTLSERLERAREAVQAYESKLAEADEAVARAEGKRMAEFEGLRAVLDELREARAAKTVAEKIEANRARPITVLVSRKTGKLHVRQGFDDIFEAPVTIADPARPLGTHVYTALVFTDGDKALRWSVVTAAGEPRSKPEPKRTRSRHAVERIEAPGLPASNPTEALDRISIPAEARERIAELIKPGSSLLVSDYGISHETGKYTDYILMTR